MAILNRLKIASIILSACANSRISRAVFSALFRSLFIRQVRNWRICPGPSGVDSLKTMAVSRLLLDNFDHIKAYWVMLGKRLAQVALHYGANDIDGTITKGGELSESYSVESNNEVKMSKAELVALIEDAGFQAVERDTVYNRVERSNVSLVVMRYSNSRS